MVLLQFLWIHKQKYFHTKSDAHAVNNICHIQYIFTVFMFKLFILHTCVLCVVPSPFYFGDKISPCLYIESTLRLNLQSCCLLVILAGSEMERQLTKSQRGFQANLPFSLSQFPRVYKANQRVRDRHKPSSNKPRLWAVKTAEFLNVIRPSTAGYTRFMSEMYLEKTEMSISPARSGKMTAWLVFGWYFMIFS